MLYGEVIRIGPSGAGRQVSLLMCCLLLATPCKKKKLAALSMLHKAKKAYYACDVIRTHTLFTRRQAVAIAT